MVSLAYSQSNQERHSDPCGGVKTLQNLREYAPKPLSQERPICFLIAKISIRLHKPEMDPGGAIPQKPGLFAHALEVLGTPGISTLIHA